MMVSTHTGYSETLSNGFRARMPQPSDNLRTVLLDSGICNARELNDCEPVVRRLCHDLPDFDSAWLDALIQHRVITPWQSEVLQSDDPLALRKGNYLLLNALGRYTFLAQHVGTQKLSVLKQMDFRDANASSRGLEKLSSIAAAAAPNVTTRHLVTVPLEILASDGDNRLYTVTSFIDGWSLESFVIRGGRLPWPVVAEIGRSLLNAAAFLEKSQQIHGEICLRNLRIQRDGRVVLVDPFSARLLHPTIALTPELKLREIEFTAPELAGSGALPTRKSEIYSIGSVCWHLLTSRSVFPDADPIRRLMHAAAHDVVDVREFVPDCPEWMAQQIHHMTRRNPELRPASTQEASARWLECTRNTRHTHSRRLVRRLPDRVVRKRRQSRSPLQKYAARTTLAALLLIGTALGVHRGFLPQTLQVFSPAADLSKTIADTNGAGARNPGDDTGNVDQREMHPVSLPSANAQGLIVLNSGQTYVAGEINEPRPVRILCAGPAPAFIILRPGETWTIVAASIELHNLVISNSSEGASPGQTNGTLLNVMCDELILNRCALINASAGHLDSCLRSQPLIDGKQSLSVVDSVFQGLGYGLHMQAPANQVDMNNVLMGCDSAAIRCDLVDDHHVMPELRMTRVTQVGGKSFLGIAVLGKNVQTVNCRILSADSVLAPEQTLIRLAQPVSWPIENLHVEFGMQGPGNPTVVPPSTASVIYFDEALQSTVELPAAQVEPNMLLAAEPTFRFQMPGHNAVGLSRFELTDYAGPKLSEEMPGIVVRRLLDIETSRPLLY